MKISERALEKIGAFSAEVDGEYAIIVPNYEVYETIESLFNKANKDAPTMYFEENIYFCEGCKKYHTNNMWTVSMMEPYYGMYCASSIEENEDLQRMYIDYLINNPNNANILGDSILEKAGWKKMDSHAVGMYGDEDGIKPQEVLKKETRDVVFSIDNYGNPFCTEYSVWVKE